jgi:hypothetical protein
MVIHLQGVAPFRTRGQGQDVAKLQRFAKFGRTILFVSVGSWRNGRGLGASAFPFVSKTNSPVLFRKNGQTWLTVN